MEDVAARKLATKGFCRLLIPRAEHGSRKFPGEFQQALRIIPAGEADDPDLLRQRTGDAHRALANGPGGPKDDDPSFHHGAWQSGAAGRRNCSRK